MTDRLSTLRLFASIVELGSISAACRAHGLSTTTGSRRVQDLEAALGATLIDRTTRTLAPTEAGQRLYERMLAPINSLDAALREAGESDAAPSGTLRILARRSFAMMHVTPLLAPFLDQHPRVTIDLELTERVDIAPGDSADLVIRLGFPAEKSLVAHPLASGRRLLCASPAYLDRVGSLEDIEDLKHHDCLTYRRAFEPGTWIFERPSAGSDGLAQRHEIAVSGPLRATNGEILRAAALDGLGIVLLPGWMVAGDIASGRLIHCLSRIRAWPSGFEDEIVVAYRRSTQTPAKITAFVAELLAVHAEALLHDAL